MKKIKKAIVQFDQYLSKVFFGVYIGWSRFAKGEFEMFCNKLFNPTTPKSLQNDNLNSLHKKGYSYFEQFVPKDSLKSVRAAYLNTIEDKSKTFSSSNTKILEKENYCINIESPENLEGIEHLVSDDLKNFLEYFYKGKFKIKKIQAWRNFHVPNSILDTSEVFSNRFHLDAHKTSLINVFVFIEDINYDQGPFSILDKSLTKQLIRSRFYNNRNNNPEKKLREQSYQCTGRSGDVIISQNFNCLHAAGIPAEGKHRDIIQLQIVPKLELFEA